MREINLIESEERHGRSLSSLENHLRNFDSTENLLRKKSKEFIGRGKKLNIDDKFGSVNNLLKKSSQIDNKSI
jgi:hypothetical protein